MFVKFATAQNREKLNPLSFSSSGAICLKTTMEKDVMVKRVHSDWDLNCKLKITRLATSPTLYH